MTAGTSQWRQDGRGGAVFENGQLVGLVSLVEDWYEPQTRVPRSAWVASFVEGSVGTGLSRVLLELDGEPATDSQRQSELVTAASSAIKAGPAPIPDVFGIPTSGLRTKAEMRELIEVLVIGMQEAQQRVIQAGNDERQFSNVSLLIAITEMMAWLRALDELASYIWESRSTEHNRQRISRRVDRFLKSPGVQPGLLASERVTRAQTGAPYEDWSIALLFHPMGWLRRDELRAFRWLAGKLLHFGPLPVVQLEQSSAGSRPFWIWRTSDKILPPRVHEERPGQRTIYDKVIAGRGVLFIFHANELAFSAGRLFDELLR